MNKICRLIAAATMFVAAPAALACDYPSRVNIPDGTTATKEEMIAGQRAVKEYVANMETYLDCLLEEEKSTRATMDNLTAEDEQLREDMLNKKYNAAVDEMETVAAHFNEQVQVYKARPE